MNIFFKKMTRNISRPLPDLWQYLFGKLLSRVWALYIKRVGVNFNLSRGAIIEGGEFITIGDKFGAGHSLWIAAVSQYLDYKYKPEIIIGSNVCCSNSVHISCTNSVTILDGVMIGSNVHITDHGHGTYVGEKQSSPFIPPAYRPLAVGSPIVIGKNVWIGDGVVVLSGVTIGDGSIIGANSVVTRNIPSNTISVGAPAVPIKSYDSASGRWLLI
jgi:acetyltransferase-like isoleucine patch superfamily enzyme